MANKKVKSKKRKSKSKFEEFQTLLKNKKVVAAVLVIVALVGVSIVGFGSATSTNLEAENASLRGPVSKGNDAKASNGQFIQFKKAESSSTERFPGDPNPRETGKSYWGAAINGNGDPSRHEDPTGKSLSVRRTYWDFRSSKINSAVNTARNDIENNRLPFISFKTNGWQRTVNGTDDAIIDDLLRRLDNLGGPVWLVVHHEPEGGASSGGVDDPAGPQGWINMQKKIRQRMDAVGTQNIAFVANLMTWTWDSRSGRNPNDWWANNVWDAYTANVYCDHEKHCGDGKDRTIDQTMWKNFEAFAESKNIPYGVGEWGDRGESVAAGQDIRDTWEYLFENNKDIVAWTYFDSNLNSPTGGWELKGEALKTFQDILKNDNKVQRINELDSSSSSLEYGTAEGTINVPEDGTYKLWVRMNTPNTSQNSVRVQIDNDNPFVMGGSNLQANTWKWVDWKNGSTSNKANLNLTAGNTKVKITGIDENVKIDRILVTNDSCTPNGTGDNCSTLPPVDNEPTVTISTPANGSQVSGKVKVRVNSDGDVRRVTFRPNNKWAATVENAPFEWEWDTTALPDGEHTMVTRTNFVGDAGNIYTEKRIKVTVKNTSPPVEPADTTAPSRPSELSKSVSFNFTGFKCNVNLNWKASTDNVGVVAYRVARQGLTKEVSSTSFSDSGLNAGTTYKYNISALDAAGNVSASTSINVKYNQFLWWCWFE